MNLRFPLFTALIDRCGASVAIKIFSFRASILASHDCFVIVLRPSRHGRGIASRIKIRTDRETYQAGLRKVRERGGMTSVREQCADVLPVLC